VKLETAGRERFIPPHAWRGTWTAGTVTSAATAVNTFCVGDYSLLGEIKLTVGGEGLP
jgi:hypothetical protein